MYGEWKINMCAFIKKSSGLKSFIPSTVDVEKPEFEAEAFRKKFNTLSFILPKRHSLS